MSSELQQVIDAAWEERDGSARDQGEVRDAVEAALRLLDCGAARVAEKGAGGWTVNQWLKKAVLLSFRLNPMDAIPGGPGGARLVGQGAVEVRRLGRDRFRAGRLPRGAGRDRPPRRLYRHGTRC